MSLFTSRLTRVVLVLAGLVLLALVAISLSPMADVEATWRPPIEILSDSDFNSTNGVVSGDGTEDDPYVISGWEMDSWYTSLKISGTTRYFVVRDVSIILRWATRDGIYLHNASNGLLENITVRGPDVAYIRLQACTNITLQNITTIDGWTIVLDDCTNTSVRDVDLRDGDGQILVATCTNCSIVRCHVAGNPSEEGYDIVDSYNISLVSCTARLFHTGILLTNSSSCSIVACVFENNTYADLHSRASSYYTNISNTRFGKTGLVLHSYCYETIDRASTVNGKPIEFHAMKVGLTFDSSVGQLLLFNCTGVNVNNLTTNGTRRPVVIHDCSNVILNNVSLFGAEVAIDSRSCRNVTVTSCSFNYTVDAVSGLYGVQFETVENLSMSSVLIEGLGPGLFVLGPYDTIKSTFVTLDDVNATVSGGNAIEIRGTNRTTVNACKVQFNNRYAIVVVEATEVTVTNNRVHDFKYGIRLQYNTRFDVSSNEVWNGRFTGIHVREYNGSVSNNLVRNCRQGIGIAIGPSGGVDVRNNTVITSIRGIVTQCLNVTMSNNTVSNNWYGIRVLGKNCTIVDCTITNSTGYGIHVYRYYCNVINCTISDMRDYGIFTASARGSNVTRCLVENARIGIRVADYVNVYLNKVINCSELAILTVGGGSRIYWNTFIMNNYSHANGIYNGPQAAHVFGVTHYDNDVEGNIWDDYEERYPTAVVLEGKFWNQPYMIGDSSDRYPLAIPVDLVPPIADAGEDIVIPQSATVLLNGTASSDDVAIYRWAWVFTYDGVEHNISRETVNFTFDIPGFYRITMTIWDQFGNSASDSMNVTVLDTVPPVPVVGDPIVVDMGKPFVLDGRGSWDTVGVTRFLWTIDPDGLNYTSEEASFVYTIHEPGEYMAVLNVSDAAGNWALGYLNITVRDNVPPVAEAGEDLVVDQGVEVAFDGTGSSDNIGIVEYRWTIWIGTTSHNLSGPEPIFAFPEPGTFKVTLTVRDGRGLSDDDELTVTVIDTMPPVVDIGEDRTVDEDTIVTLDAFDSYDNVGIVRYRWTYTIDGDRNERSGSEVIITFEDPGSYTVFFRAEDAEGNWAVDFVVITVRDVTRPSADAGGDREIGQSQVLVLDGGNSTDNSGIVDYQWLIEEKDGPVSLEGKTVTHVFNSTGTYLVTLTVTDEADLPDTTSIRVTVVDTTPPVADSGENATVMVSTTYRLDGSNSTDNDAIVRYTWTFEYNGKLETLTTPRPSFYFNRIGQFEILLTVVDGGGNSDTDTVWITVVSDIMAWRLGPFSDQKGNPIRGVDVTVVVSGTRYQANTDGTGWMEIDVKWTDLQSPAHVTGTKDGWDKLEFDLELDEAGNPVGEIPPMTRKKRTDKSPGAGAILTLAAILVPLIIMKRTRRT